MFHELQSRDREDGRPSRRQETCDALLSFNRELSVICYSLMEREKLLLCISISSEK